MKKTIAVLFASAMCAMSAMGATNLYYSPNSNADAGEDMLSISKWGYFWHIKNSANSNLEYAASRTMTEGVFSSGGFDINTPRHTEDGTYHDLITQDNVNYNLIFSGEHVSLSLNSAIYLNSTNITQSAPSSYTIALGTDGCITTAKGLKLGDTASVTLSADFSQQVMAELFASVQNGAQVVYSRDLLIDKNNEGPSQESLTFSSSALASSGLVYVGSVSSIDDIQYGEYGIVCSSDASDGYKVALVAKTPEPATATLSLLALAALAARRKRH